MIAALGRGILRKKITARRITLEVAKKTYQMKLVNFYVHKQLLNGPGDHKTTDSMSPEPMRFTATFPKVLDGSRECSVPSKTGAFAHSHSNVPLPVLGIPLRYSRLAGMGPAPSCLRPRLEGTLVRVVRERTQTEM